MTTVFGVDHSPWTQAVVLAHADLGITVCLRPYPTLGYFLRFGLVMPVCWDANGQEMADSLFIIQTLSALATNGSEPRMMPTPEILNVQIAPDFASLRGMHMLRLRRGTRRHHHLETRPRMISHRRCLFRRSDMLK